MRIHLQSLYLVSNFLLDRSILMSFRKGFVEKSDYLVESDCRILDIYEQAAPRVDVSSRKLSMSLVKGCGDDYLVTKMKEDTLF